MLTTTYILDSLVNELPSSLKLGEFDVQIWKIDLTNKYDWNPYLDLLSENEHAKADMFKFEINKSQFLAGKIFSKIILAAQLGITAYSIDFEFTHYDKPYLSAHPIHFNISHSKDYVIVGITRLSPIGVDVEFINRNIEIRKLSRRFFSQNEAEIVTDSKNSNAPLSFYNCWTKKEAFIKAHGDGLNIPLSNFEVDIESPKSTLKHLDLESEIANEWMLEEIALHPDYQAAFCIRSKNYKVRFFELK